MTYFLWLIVHPGAVYANVPPIPRGPHYSCDLQDEVARINWFRTYSASSYEFRFDSNAPSWNGSCSAPNDGDVCISTTNTNVTIPIIPLVEYDWWVHAVNLDGYSPALDGPNFICQIPLPRLFHYSCINNNTQIDLTWQSAIIPERYELRFDVEPNSWSNDCNNLNEGDICTTSTQNRSIVSITPGVTYRSWVHGVQGGIWTQAVDGPTFRCGAIPTATSQPTPTNTSVPTHTPILTPTATPTQMPPTNTPIPPTTIPPTLTTIPNSPTPTLVYCSRRAQGDADCNNVINQADRECWKAQYKNNNVPIGSCISSDFNTDGKVTILDYSIWIITLLKERGSS